MSAQPAQVAAAQPVNHDRLVGEVPAGSTPHVLEGSWVKAIAQVGNKIIIGGKFTKVGQSGTQYARTNLFAIDANTRKVDPNFAPQVSGEVLTVAASPDGHVLVGGWFGSINGQGPASLQKLNINTGKQVTTFKASPNNAVYDIKVVGSRAFVGGRFTKINGQTRNALASVNATNGTVQAYTNVPFTGVHNHGSTHIYKLAASPDGSKLVAIGNFNAVAGQTRRQVAMLDLGASAAALRTEWNTSQYSAACSSSAFDFYVRDVDFSPNGSFFAIVTTGGPYGTRNLCDSTARWETGATGTDLSPSWVAWTGGDTLHSVAVSSTAVYIGGHQRWANNPEGRDSSRQGAVTRVGLGALDPENGMPYSWNPGRDPKGIGAFELTLTPTGLYVGSDTDFFGPQEHYRAKLGFFQLNAGKVPPPNTTAQLPGKVYVAKTDGSLVSRVFDGTTAGPDVPAAANGWDEVRGSTLIDGNLWYAKADGNFYRRAFNGVAFGAEELVDPYTIPTWDAVHPTWKGTKPTFYGTTAATLTSMFYAQGRLYYTRSGSSSLYYRYFTPESGVLGAQEFNASNGMSWSNTGGMFVSGGKLYFVVSDGSLRRVDFTGGLPTGTPTTVSGPGTDGKDWRGRALFLAKP
ncbi:hypothetical protein DPM19_15245 [Actinomadura craniellae]|uniref:Uncharacterized protein n=1 Tax=Actinomadura craniellae TaxID=2231787 RepID=A0A365H5E2_9ACTN|nr:hypothetical protein DPM19_15245 [Actinomadura craniellae]